MKNYNEIVDKCDPAEIMKLTTEDVWKTSENQSNEIFKGLRDKLWASHCRDEAALKAFEHFKRIHVLIGIKVEHGIRWNGEEGFVFTYTRKFRELQNRRMVA